MAAESLAEWAAANAPAAKVLAQCRDSDGPMLDRALEHVRGYIAKHGLVLFGGLAIDYALRLRGSAIYPDGERPDFDALSDRSVEHAYALADELSAAGFESVSAIRAIHVQTMRVRVDYRPVADFGYAPPDVYKGLPTFDYRGIRVIHPDYQRMDMHLAFCFPFNGAPREDVFSRWRKDLKRFNLIADLYPIVDPCPAAAVISVVAEFDAALDGPNVALTGFAGYAVLRAALSDEAARRGPAARARLESVRAPALRVALDGATRLALELPTGAVPEVVIATTDPDAAIADRGTAFDPYVDIYPAGVRRDSAVALSTRGRLLAVVGARLGERVVRVASPQHICLYFLCASFRQPAQAALYRGYYTSTLEIIDAAEEIYRDASSEAAAQDFAKSPFAPSVETMGSVNTDAAYLIKTASSAARLADSPPAVLGLDAGVAQILSGLPANYYPARHKAHPAFDYASCALFQRSGADTKK